MTDQVNYSYLNCGAVVNTADRQEHQWKNHSDMLRQMLNEALYNPNELTLQLYN